MQYLLLKRITINHEYDGCEPICISESADALKELVNNNYKITGNWANSNYPFKGLQCQIEVTSKYHDYEGFLISNIPSITTYTEQQTQHK